MNGQRPENLKLQQLHMSKKCKDFKPHKCKVLDVSVKSSVKGRLVKVNKAVKIMKYQINVLVSDKMKVCMFNDFVWVHGIPLTFCDA